MALAIALLLACGDDAVVAADDTTTGDGTGTTSSTSTSMSTTIADESSTTTVPSTSETTGASPSESSSTGGPALLDAVDDTYFATQDVELPVEVALGVSANDVAGESDVVFVADFDPVTIAGGSVIVFANGDFTYTPLAGFWGRDSFGYTVEDGIGATASAVVTVFVAPLRIPLADVAAGAGGFVVEGGADGDWSGFSVSGAGDVNGDGRDDLIVGALSADANGGDSGRSYVVFGKADMTAVALPMLGDGGFAIDGEAASDYSGQSVSGAGDVNGDGMDDLIVGAPYADPNGVSSGRSYVVFGKADTTAVILSMLGAGGFVLDGEAAGDYSGRSVSGAGDVNGDGMDDLIVGADEADVNGSNSGRSYVVFGKADTTAVALSVLGDGGFVLDGAAAGDRAGHSVSGAGDVNGDGMDDLIVGANEADPNGASSGRSYVVFGKADTTAVALSMLGVGGFVLDGESDGDASGRSVSGAGDVNGDGMDDLIVGAPFANGNAANSGRSYVVFGKADTTPVALSMLGAGGFVLGGEAMGDASGWSVSGAGDVNGDGLDDLIVGAPQADPNGMSSGRSYVVFGKADTAAVDLSMLGATGFTLDGEREGDGVDSR